MGISAIGSYGTGYDNYASGKSILTASDNPSGLAISEELTSQSNGYSVGKSNADTAKDLLNVSDGGLSSIADSLQRIRELSVKARNGIYSKDDKRSMQDEVDQLKKQIESTAKNTQFNTIPLLSDQSKDLNVATNPDGSGVKISNTNATLQALGIEDYDLTGHFDISKIDDALDKVNSARSNIGSTSNTLSYISNYNSYSNYNLNLANSRLSDVDYGTYVSDKQKNDILEKYKFFMMKNSTQNQSFLNGLLV